MYEVLPRVPWLQKEHFIIAAPKCSLKPLSKSLTVVFQTDMSVHRSKKRENVSKGKTDTFRYPNLHHLFRRKESKTYTYEGGNRHRILF